jgi:hypothetical protein
MGFWSYGKISSSEAQVKRLEQENIQPEENIEPEKVESTNKAVNRASSKQSEREKGDPKGR